ncbi:CvpA family protein [Streptococcus sp. X16XC17]|uniref:CvpA family protein n=1 Tax=unclassified Streptococcus TaxID=2608887 RepID=UPI00066FC900|nr:MULTISPECIES: CvpA family protein [unclassified Streptococcus]TCD45568.1 CvpA family protein [Streptococcus sp. X16XC17]
MISIVLLIILAWSFYIGYSRGLVLQAFYGFSSVLALIIAAGNYKSLASIFYLWVPFATATEGASTYYFDSKYLFELDKIFYAGLAFLAIYMVVYAIMRFIGIFVHLLKFVSPDTTMMNVISGGISVIVTLISIQMVLTVVATIPLATVQNTLHDSWLANGIIQYTPIMSSLLKNWWVTKVVGG